LAPFGGQLIGCDAGEPSLRRLNEIMNLTGLAGNPNNRAPIHHVNDQ
jgi:hypothetical protein